MASKSEAEYISKFIIMVIKTKLHYAKHSYPCYVDDKIKILRG
jgi:hypothetical protein